jgi:quercetin dioxygenase-like cupin family protein
VFSEHNDEGYSAAAPGIVMKTLCHGGRTLLAEFRLDAGSALPSHAHPHEQTGYLVAGRLLLTIGEERREVGAGDAWCIPGGVVHCAEALEAAVAVEVFSPVRRDYVAGARVAASGTTK